VGRYGAVRMHGGGRGGREGCCRGAALPGQGKARTVGRGVGFALEGIPGGGRGEEVGEGKWICLG